MKATAAVYLVFGIAVSSQCQAGPSSYTCSIENFHSPSSMSKSFDWIGQQAMKSQVGIDRNTGRVIHPVIGNTSFNEVTLLNRGSANWSFKALADSGNGGNVRYYEVHEYSDGAAKPFLAVADGLIYFGWCE